ncbi:hypothetical protein [Chitinophaga sp. 22620]|uniref:hypothetical protein n=1 Tax=Chitinophaga sp. 22620 TaxID=3453952 RepID=UPI003F87787E
MDEKFDNLAYPKPIEVITNECFVYRQAHIDKLKNKRIPSESHFIPDSDGLSVYWNRHCTVNEIYILIGLSYRHKKTEYKNHEHFKVFKLNAGMLRSINGVQDVLHTPIINGNPAPLGQPNNYSHSSVIYENDEEIRMKICDFISENYDECYCDFEPSSLNDQIAALRERLDNTEYHRY